ncbi:MAG: 3'-5' exonuclease [Bacteroidota bacterium]|nr:3'-5' exonuclease [Bacteroidota bacterium]
MVKIDLTSILFIDIETISGSEKYEQLSERFQALWNHKAKYLHEEGKTVADLYFEKAGIFAEFGKIIVIGVGFFYYNESKELCFKSKSIQGNDEQKLLNEFSELIAKFNNRSLKLCAHNGKEFDFPYICRRMLVNRIPLPPILQLNELKPWEVPHLDTLEMWKFGDKKNYTSLELLAAIFNIPTSKDGIDGSKVNAAYYLSSQLKEISDYCQRDVIVMARIFLKLHQLPDIKEENIFNA